MTPPPERATRPQFSYPQRGSWILPAIPWGAGCLFFLPHASNVSAARVAVVVLGLLSILLCVMWYVDQRRYRVSFFGDRVEVRNGRQVLTIDDSIVRAIYGRKSGISLLSPQATPGHLKLEFRTGTEVLVPLYFVLSLQESSFLRRWTSRAGLPTIRDSYVD